MQKSQQQADHSFALKDSYVGGIKQMQREDRMIPSNAQQPDVLQASGHMFLDEGKQGVVNDGDPSLYYHRGGNTHRFEKPELGNPLPGGPGERRIDNMDPEAVPGLRNQFDNYQKRLQDEKYGTGNLARNEFSDPMTIKSVIG